MDKQFIIPKAEPFFFPGGPTGCLLVHGFTATPQVMRNLGVYLNKQGYTVLGIRLAGHATSVEDMIRSRYQDWLASIEEGWHLLQGITERVFLMGHSMGGSLSLILASRFPVAGVVGMSARYEIPIGFARSFPQLTRILSVVYPCRPKRKGDWFNPQAADGYIRYLCNPLSSSYELHLLLKELRPLVPKIDVPVLFIHSRDDDYILPYQAEWLYEHTGSLDKEFIWVEKANHHITQDGDTSVVFQAVVEFVVQRVK
jgi:carboxylesterase